MTPLGILRQLIKGITQNTTPNQIAGGAAMGMLIGLMPKANLTTQILLIMLMIFRTNVSVALAMAAVFSLLQPVGNLLAHPIGYKLLAQTPFLYGFWTRLYNTPVFPWTAFNNTLLLGNLIIGLVLFVPAFIVAKKLALLYETSFKEKVAQSRFAKALKSSWLVDWYFKVTG